MGAYRGTAGKPARSPRRRMVAYSRVRPGHIRPYTTVARPEQGAIPNDVEGLDILGQAREQQMWVYTGPEIGGS